MKTKSLLYKTLTQFITCTAVLLILSTPLFYWLTKVYYAEDLIEVIDNIKKGLPIPDLDIEEDIMQGIMIQFGLIIVILGIAIALTLTFITKNTWRPFDQTLKLTENFKLAKGEVPMYPNSDIAEFARLVTTLKRLINNNIQVYRSQKEFTENASHELQTPLAIFRSKVDLLMQQPNLTQKQAEIIQDLYKTISRLSLLNRNLLLLARIDNKQYADSEETDVVAEINHIIPDLEALADGIKITKEFTPPQLKVFANKTLLESMINNLVVNAVRHNVPGGNIFITITDECLSVANSAQKDEPLDGVNIFNRFYRQANNGKGNGLGLAIVKAICEYHGWDVSYSYRDKKHVFTIKFNKDNDLDKPKK